MNTKLEVQVSKRIAYSGIVSRVRVDSVLTEDGIAIHREVIEHDPSVVIIPVDVEKKIVLVRQFRYPVDNYIIEAPAGVIEGSESPEQCAQRELQEETGYKSEDLVNLGSFWMSPGYCTELMYAFVARKLVHSPLQPDPDENIELVRKSRSDVQKLIRTGGIRDAKTIAAMFMLQDYDQRQTH